MIQKQSFILIFILACNLASAQDFTFQNSDDLNGDKKNDNISLKAEEGSNTFTLEISGNKITDTFNDGEPDGFKVVDIDKTDTFKEIAVHTPGPSDDDEYMIFWYDGNNIKKMAHLSRWPTFNGNGIVYVDGWEGFWTRRDKYLLNSTTRTLELVPQFAYYVGTKAKVKTGFSIYQERDLKQQVALLGLNSEIEILLCDQKNKEWNDHLYLIKASSGLIGWAKNSDIYNNLEGLHFAD